MRRNWLTVAALLLVATVALAQQIPSIPFAPSNGGGGLSTAAASALFLKLDASNDPLTGQLALQAGTVGAPAVTLGDSTTGFYRSAANAVDLAIAGANALTISKNGTGSSATFSFRPTATGATADLFQAGSVGTATIRIASNASLLLDIGFGFGASSGGAYGGNGTAAAPMFSFTSDTDVGMYRIGANNLGFSVNGANILDLSTTRLSTPVGVQADTATRAIALGSVSAVDRLDSGGGTSQRVRVLTTSNALGGMQLESLSVGITPGTPVANSIYSQGGVRADAWMAIGGAISASRQFMLFSSAPSLVIDKTDAAADTKKWYTNVGATTVNHGIMNDAEDNGDEYMIVTRGASLAVTSISLRAGANPAPEVLNLAAGQLSMTTAGTVSAPSLAFIGDLNTGIWRSGADVIEMTGGGGLAGVARFACDGNTSTCGTPSTNVLTGGYLVASQDGTAGTPAIQWTGDANTGIWHPAADMITFSVGGLSMLGLATDGVYQLQPGTGTATFMRVGGQLANTPGLVTCDSNHEGALQYIDDADDGKPPIFCICMANADRTAKHWIAISGTAGAAVDVGTTCSPP